MPNNVCWSRFERFDQLGQVVDVRLDWIGGVRRDGYVRHVVSATVADRAECFCKDADLMVPSSQVRDATMNEDQRISLPTFQDRQLGPVD
jgi:hypothetical protein